MKSSPLKLLVTSGLLLFSGMSLQAQIDSDLKLELRCLYQAKLTPKSTRDAGKVGLVRLDSKQLINLLAKQTGVRFAGGSKLKIAPNGSVFVANSKGQSLGDVSQYFKATIDHDNSLFDGSRHRQSGEENSRYYYPLVLNIDLPDLKFTVQGIITESYKVSRKSKLGVQITTSAGFSAVNGKGSINGEPACFIGNLRMRGKEAGIVN